MTSKPDIFDRLTSSEKESSGDIFDRLSASKKYFGQEGSLIGGQTGAAIETASEYPSQLAKRAPQAVAKVIESVGPEGGKFIAQLVQGLLGQPSEVPDRETFLSHLTPPQKTKIASELLGEWASEGLPENLQEGGEAIADLEGLILPFLKRLAPSKATLKKLSSIGERPPSPGAPSPSGPGFADTVGELKGAAKDATQLVKEVGKDLKQKILGPNISEEIPKSLSKERIHNTTTGGMELEKAVAKPYEELTAQENKAYEISKKANKSIEAIHPELVDDLRSSIQELEKIPDPSAPMRRYIVSSRKLLRDLAEIDHSGGVVGYKPISNQTLINQIQEYNQIPQFDFPTDTKTGIFKSLIRKLTESIEKTAAKNPEAIQSWQKAKEIHSRKSDLFADRDVYKWTKLADKNYSKEYLNSIDIDKIRKMTRVLELSEEGKSALQKLKRDLVEKVFDEHFSVSGRFDKKEISRALAELEPVLTPEELKAIELLFEEAQTPGAKAASVVSKFYRYMKRPSQAVKDIGKIT